MFDDYKPCMSPSNYSTDILVSDLSDCECTVVTSSSARKKTATRTERNDRRGTSRKATTSKAGTSSSYKLPSTSKSPSTSRGKQQQPVRPKERSSDEFIFDDALDAVSVATTGAPVASLDSDDIPMDETPKKKPKRPSDDPDDIMVTATPTKKQPEPLESKFKYFKSSYTTEEDYEMLKFILKENQFSDLRGKSFWLYAQSKNASGQSRTWQSLKERFLKYIFPRIHLYNMKDNDRDKIVKGMPPVGNRPGPKNSGPTMSMLMSNRPSSSGSEGSPPVTARIVEDKWKSGEIFTEMEDIYILDYIIKAVKRENKVVIKGNEFWKKMAESDAFKGLRSYQGLKERFFKRIYPRIYKFDISSDDFNRLHASLGFGEDIVSKFKNELKLREDLKNRVSGTPKMNTEPKRVKGPIPSSSEVSKFFSRPSDITQPNK